MGRMTWAQPNGDWGIKGVDLNTTNPTLYVALMRLKELENFVEHENLKEAFEAFV